MSDTMPVSMLKTQAAKDEVAKYRRIGLRDDELAFVMDDGAEVVVVNKAGLVKLMRAAPCGRVEALRRLQGKRLVNFDGTPGEEQKAGEFIGLDGELELFRDDG